MRKVKSFRRRRRTDRQYLGERLVFNVKSDRAPSGRTGLFVMGRMENKNDEI